MSHRNAILTEPAASDSWLPVALNILGALLIVVLIAAERARHILIPNVDALTANSAIAQARRTEADVEQDVRQLSAQIKVVDSELSSRKEQRELLATMMAISQQKIADQRAALDDQSRKAYDLARDVSLAKAGLEKLKRQPIATAVTQPVNLKVESYATPLAKPVDGKELHLQLQGQRVTVVPVEELIDRLKRSAQEKVWKLRDQPEMTDYIGPIGGFRMRYTLVRMDVSEPGRSGSYVQLSHWDLLPVSPEIGETISEALDPNSLLRAKLDRISPRTHTVTLWVYPDSFELFRQMRKEFYQLGYHVAGRPLPEDLPIGGSPSGSKSAAQ